MKATMRKSSLAECLDISQDAVDRLIASGQSPQTVEHYAKQRNRTVLGEAAILKWRAK